jgi:hypothetical protein
MESPVTPVKEPSRHENNKKELSHYIWAIEQAKAQYEKAKKNYEIIANLKREQISMSRNGDLYIFNTIDEYDCERVIFARKDRKTKRWVLREGRKQLMKKCPYNLNEIRLKIAIGEI